MANPLSELELILQCKQMSLVFSNPFSHVSHIFHWELHIEKQSVLLTDFQFHTLSLNIYILYISLFSPIFSICCDQGIECYQLCPSPLQYLLSIHLFF